jgi:ectoine hydroxylase-related dioxygenase (phytanoyl-CoA dioxygenase family)
MSTIASRYLTREQLEAYRRDGYLALPEIIDAARVAELRAVTADFIERSRAVTTSDDLFDLDSRHKPEAPSVRRIKNPADHHPLYAWVAFESPIPDIVAEVIGPDVKFHHSKLNFKGAHGGAPVDWHQDAPFYPHSNDDVLAVGLLLDDATANNGAMAVLPGSHFGPVYEHYDGDRFVGFIQPDDLSRLDLGQAKLLALPAGSIHIHHYRLVHGSAPNISPAPRRLLINAYAAADALPLTPNPARSPFSGRLVRGQEPRYARRDSGVMRLPPDWSRGYTSIYELQTGARM